MQNRPERNEEKRQREAQNMAEKKAAYATEECKTSDREVQNTPQRNAEYST